MAQQEEIVLWIDQRWKNAIEKHLKDETLQEHLENVLDELCNRLPEREYERISRAIQSEAAAQRAEEEAARTYAAYHVTEHGQEWYFKTSPGEELLAVGKKLRSYITSEKVTVASQVAVQRDPMFRAYYEKKAAEGLKYMTIIGHVTRKMTAVVFAILRDHKVYEPVLPTAA